MRTSESLTEFTPLKLITCIDDDVDAEWARVYLEAEVLGFPQLEGIAIDPMELLKSCLQEGTYSIFSSQRVTPLFANASEETPDWGRENWKSRGAGEEASPVTVRHSVGGFWWSFRMDDPDTQKLRDLCFHIDGERLIAELLLAVDNCLGADESSEFPVFFEPAGVNSARLSRCQLFLEAYVSKDISGDLQSDENDQRIA